MECQSCTESLTALMDGELNAEEESCIKNHLSECSYCRQEFASLNMAREWTARLNTLEPSPQMWSAIRSRIEPAPLKPIPLLSRLAEFLSRRWMPVTATAVLASMLLLGTFTLPENRREAELQEMFNLYMEQREKVTVRTVTFSPASSGVDSHGRGINPFIEPISHRNDNPFSRE